MTANTRTPTTDTAGRGSTVPSGTGPTQSSPSHSGTTHSGTAHSGPANAGPIDRGPLGGGATDHGTVNLETVTIDTVTIDSPVGGLELRARDGFLTHVLFADSAPATPGEPTNPVLRAAVEQLKAYFAGELTTFDLPLRPEGTPFQQRVWAALADIPYGETRTYAEIARAVGAPTAYRAVGAANGQNPLPIVLPCHRVVGSNGSLTGYGGGMDRKRTLLELEARVSLQRAFA